MPIGVEMTCFDLYGVPHLQHAPPDFVPSLLTMVAEGGNWWRLREASILVTEKLKGHVLELRAGVVLRTSPVKSPRKFAKKVPKLAHMEDAMLRWSRYTSSRARALHYSCAALRRDKGKLAARRGRKA